MVKASVFHLAPLKISKTCLCAVRDFVFIQKHYYANSLFQITLCDLNIYSVKESSAVEISENVNIKD